MKMKFLKKKIDKKLNHTKYLLIFSMQHDMFLSYQEHLMLYIFCSKFNCTELIAASLWVSASVWWGWNSPERRIMCWEFPRTEYRKCWWNFPPLGDCLWLQRVYESTLTIRTCSVCWAIQSILAGRPSLRSALEAALFFWSCKFSNASLSLKMNRSENLID